MHYTMVDIMVKENCTFVLARTGPVPLTGVEQIYTISDILHVLYVLCTHVTSSSYYFLSNLFFLTMMCNCADIRQPLDILTSWRS